MKLLSTLLLVVASICLRAQTPVTVTMTGIGDLKLGMKKAEVEKLLATSLQLPHLTANNDDYYHDTVHVTYKGMDADLIFQREYVDEKKFNISVWEIRSNSPLLKTKSGIGIGDDKYKIISTYEGYVIWIMPDYEKDYTVKSKTKSTVWLHGDAGNVIVFYLDNNKVTAMSVSYYEGD